MRTIPISEWHDALGEPTIADAILDRLVHNAHRIELRGDSLRRSQDGEHRLTDGPSEASQAAQPPPKGNRLRNRAAEMPAEAR